MWLDNDTIRYDIIFNEHNNILSLQTVELTDMCEALTLDKEQLGIEKEDLQVWPTIKLLLLSLAKDVATVFTYNRIPGTGGSLCCLV